ncbi:MAG: hypothetical protein EBW14_21825, partial [Oxalobacteraceae bacterium]|nr:hypothetical protein [Oxalobacteraceae bacterium]
FVKDEMHTSVNRGQMPGFVDDRKKKGAHLHVRPNGSKLPLLLLETTRQTRQTRNLNAVQVNLLLTTDRIVAAGLGHSQPIFCPGQIHRNRKEHCKYMKTMTNFVQTPAILGFISKGFPAIGRNSGCQRQRVRRRAKQLTVTT